MTGGNSSKNHFLQLVTSTQPKQRHALLKTMCHDQLKYICEIMLNFLKETFQIPTHIKRKLAPYKSLIRFLADKAVSWARKKNFLGINNNHSVLGRILKHLLKYIENNEEIHLTHTREV